MDIAQLDAAIRIAGAALLLFLAAMLLRDGRGSREAILFLPLSICVSAFLIGNTPDSSSRLSGIAGEIASLLSGFAAVFLWWFCLSCFDRLFRPRGLILAAGIGWFCVAAVDHGLLGAGLAGRGLSWLLVGSGFLIVAHLAWRLLRDRAGDLLERRRDARWLVVLLLGGQLLIDLSVDLIFGFAWRPRGFTMAQNTAILAFSAWFAAAMLRVRDAEVFAADSAPAASLQPAGLSGPDARLLERLRILIEIDRVYLDPELDFLAFVRRMGAPERTVRRLIRSLSGQDHFRSFLNVHRVAEARRLLGDPVRGGDKLIAIAMDSGFASLASFNRVFRALEGRTPSAYRSAVQGGAPGLEEGFAAF